MTGFDATLDTDKKSGDLQDKLVKITQRAVHQEREMECQKGHLWNTDGKLLLKMVWSKESAG